MYIHGHHESVLRSHRWRTAENSAAHLVPHLRAGMSLLDVGCGPGTLTCDLAALVWPGQVIATEIGEAELALGRAEAQTRALAGGNHTTISFVVADVHALDFADDSFDVVHAHQVLQHVVDPVRALGEMRRVCRPGGIIAVRDGDYSGFTWFPEIPELDDWLSLYLSLARTNAGEPDAGRRLLSWAHAAGLSDVVATSSTWCYANDEDRAWWGGMWADRIVDSAIARQAVSTGMASESDLARLARGWRTWTDHPDGWFSVLHGELICRV